MISTKFALVVKTDSKKDFKLPFASVISLSSSFAIDNVNGFIYTATDKVVSYTVDPLNERKSMEYKKPIHEILVNNNTLFFLNSDSLTLYSKSSFNIFHSDFSEASLFSFLENVAVQRRNSFDVFDSNLSIVKSMEGQCFFISEQIFLIGDMNTLIVKREERDLKILVPDLITGIVHANGKIFVMAGKNIYSMDLQGNSMATMEYHEQKILAIVSSLCGKYLYSNDGNRICCWCTKNEVVVGFIDDPQGFTQMGVVDLKDRSYKEECNIIDKN